MATFPPHTFARNNLWGKSGLFHRNYGLNLGLGEIFSRQVLLGAVMSLVPKDLLMFEMDPKAVAICMLVKKFLKCYIFKFNVKKERKKLEKFSGVLKVRLPPPQFSPFNIGKVKIPQTLSLFTHQ